MMHRSLSDRELFLLYEDMMSGNNTFDDDTPVAPVTQ